MANTNTTETETTTARPVYGSKHVERRDITEIAKLVRADIKAAIKAGVLAPVKVSVRIQRGTMSRSLDVYVTEAPEWMLIWDRAYVRHAVETNFAPYRGRRYSASAHATIKRLQAMVNAYNRNDSDIMVDYYNVDFYSTVDFSHDLSIQDREAAEREVRQEMAA